MEPASAFRIHQSQRQHDPVVAKRSLDSIRELQAAWLALGLHRRRPPHMLSTRSYPLQDDIDWTDRQVRSFKVSAAAPAARLPGS